MFILILPSPCRLEGYEAGAKDKTEFLEWQRKMKAKDMAEQLAEIEKRRLLGKMSYEEAILSREKIAEENRQKVAEMKEQVSPCIWENISIRKYMYYVLCIYIIYSKTI